MVAGTGDRTSDFALPISLSRWPRKLALLSTHKLATDKAIDGKVADEATVCLPPTDEAELLESLEEPDRVEGMSAEELFDRLNRIG